MPAVQKLLPPFKVQLKFAIQRIGWCLKRKQLNKLIMCLMNTLPSHTTFAASWRWTLRDSNWFLLQVRLPDHWSSSGSSAVNFSMGSCAVWSVEFRWVLKISRDQAGPSHFWGCNGKPSFLHTANAVARFCWQDEESWGPTVMKSSK